MAIIGKIREKSWLLIAFIGLALLAFILSDYQSFFGQPDFIGYGTIDGQKVDMKLYDRAVENYKKNDAMEFQQQQRQYTLRDEANSENKAWYAIVDSIILQKEFDALGLSVSEREFEAYFYGTDGFTISPSLEQSFRDPATGLYSAKLLRKRVDEMKTSKEAGEKAAWEQTKSSFILQRLQQKYYQLISNGVYVTKLEAKNAYLAENQKKSISFVMKPFSSIPDADIKITDKELKEYFDTNKSKAKYQIRSNTRDIKYVSLNITPSKDDSTKFNTELNNLKTKFAGISTAKEDSIFVTRNSEFPVYMPKTAFRNEQSVNNQNFTYPVMMDSVFAAAQVGQVVGPYMDKGKYRLAKVISKNNYLYTVRHILLEARKGDSLAIVKQKIVADSLMKVVNADNFGELVAKHSADQGSVATGGKIENFFHEQMVPEFSNFAYDNQVGKIGYVLSDYGYHIIEVLEKNQGYGLAIIEKTLTPSDESLDNLNILANELVGKFINAVDKKKTLTEKNNAFDTLASKLGYFPMSITIDDRSYNVSNMNTPLAEDKLVALAYGTKVQAGEVNPAPIKDDNRYIIAMLSLKKDKGEPTFEAIEAQLRRDLMMDKKAAILKSKLNSTDLNKLAADNSTQVQTAEIRFQDASIPQGGYDPEIIGSLFHKGVKDGTTTLPTQGRSGVYVIRVNSTIAAPATQDYSKEVERLTPQKVNTAQQEAVRALREKNNIVDNRRLAKIGVRN